MDVLVLSGGMGRRLEQARKRIQGALFPSLQAYDGQEGPKGLATLNIGDYHRPLLDWHLSIYRNSASLERIFLGLGAASQMIIDYYHGLGDVYDKTPIFYLRERHPAGTIAPLVNMKNQYGFSAGKPLVLANGDNLINFNFDHALQDIHDNSLFKEKGLDNLVFNIITPVPHEKSDQYGVIELDESGQFARCFHEKQAIEKNPFVTVNGQKKSYINTGFSLIMNPQKILEKYLDSHVEELVAQLEAGKLDYKTHEKSVKYETMYEKIAQSGDLAVIKYDDFWADSGTEAQMLEIEVASCMKKGLQSTPPN